MVGDPEWIEAAKNTSWRAREVRAQALPAPQGAKHQKNQEDEDRHNDSERVLAPLVRHEPGTLT